MSIDELREAALEELMAENDGVNPNSHIPVEQQLATKRAEYIKMLELTSFKARIQLAMELVQNQIKTFLQQDQFEQLFVELSFAGVILEQHPDREADELGVSRKTLELLCNFGKQCLQERKVREAAAIFTLCTVLERSRFIHWFLLGASLQELGEYQEAISAYETANQITEEEPLALLFLAECFLCVSDIQKAKLYLDKAIAVMKGKPNNPGCDEVVARIQAKIKR